MAQEMAQGMNPSRREDEESITGIGIGNGWKRTARSWLGDVRMRRLVLVWLEWLDTRLTSPRWLEKRTDSYIGQALEPWNDCPVHPSYPEHQDKDRTSTELNRTLCHPASDHFLFINKCRLASIENGVVSFRIETLRW